MSSLLVSFPRDSLGASLRKQSLLMLIEVLVLRANDSNPYLYCS